MIGTQLPAALVLPESVTNMGVDRTSGLKQRVITVTLVATSLAAATGAGGAVSPTRPDFSVIAGNPTTAGLRPGRADQGIPGSLRRIRDNSGLAWGEVAQAVGVSRRTIHNWLSGLAVSARHAEALSELARLVSSVGDGAPQLIRSLLLAPDATGVSPLGRLASSQQVALRRADLSATDRLQPESEQSAPPVRRRHDGIPSVPLTRR